MAGNELTTISLPKTTVERLKALGCKGETYDDIVCRLLEKKNCKGLKYEKEALA